MQYVKYFLALSLIFVSAVMYCQSPAKDLQDLVGVKGRDAETQFENRGYVHMNTSKSDYDVYSTWWNSRKKKCVTYRLSDGRIQSVVNVPSSDCNRSSGSGNQANARLDDIEGLSVDSAAERMGSRGFTEVNQFKRDGKTHRVYYNRKTRQCVDLRSMHGKVGQVENSTKCNK